MTALAPGFATDIHPPPRPTGWSPDLAQALRGPEQTFFVPVEMVLYQANATGQMFLRRWREKGATFARTARVWRVGERLVGEVAFLVPIGPEKQTDLVVQLSPALWENLA